MLCEAAMSYWSFIIKSAEVNIFERHLSSDT